MGKPNVGRSAQAIGTANKVLNKALWAIILVTILGVSGYSLFFVARSLGVPPPIAVAFSTCFDGVALLAANYSLRYAQAGLSGSFPRAVVRIAAACAAFVQTLHVYFGHEPPGAALVWASLPVSAVTVYEIHIRWERRKALAKAGQVYPSPLPSFGLITWALYPLRSIVSLERIVGRRMEAIERMAMDRPALAAVEEPKAETVPKVTLPRAGVTDITTARRRSAHAPKKHIREWAKAQGLPISDRARIPAAIEEQYRAANGAGDG